MIAIYIIMIEDHLAQIVGQGHFNQLKRPEGSIRQSVTTIQSMSSTLAKTKECALATRWDGLLSELNDEHQTYQKISIGFLDQLLNRSLTVII